MDHVFESLQIRTCVLKVNVGGDKKAQNVTNCIVCSYKEFFYWWTYQFSTFTISPKSCDHILRI